MVFVIYLRRFQVSQILEYKSALSAGGFYKWSKQDRMLNIKVYTTCPSGFIDQHHYLKYDLFIAESFSLEKIQSSNLPHSLVPEILTKQMYWIWVVIQGYRESNPW